MPPAHPTAGTRWKIFNRAGHGGPQGGGLVSLLPTRVSPEQQASAAASKDNDFKLTMLEAPSLPVSLIHQVSWLWRERYVAPSPDSETRLPVLDMRPWFRNLPEQIRSLRAPAPAAAAITSRPEQVTDLWQDFPQNPFSWANSVLIHLLALTAMVMPFAIRQMLHPTPMPQKTFELTPLTFTLPHLHGKADETHGGGGGGARAPLPASRGALPPFARTQFAPPAVVIPKVAALAMPATLLGPPELKLPAMKLDMRWGDPQGVLGPPSQGPGVGGGIGDGKGTGVGPGTGPGAGPGSGGGCCGGPLSVGNGVSEPIAIYSPEPAYSDEARKAKFQGIVLLWIVVDAKGNVRDVQIAKPLGMGLDEEAVKTVSTWKFKPALRQGVPVPVQVQVEVSFRLF